MNHTSSGFAGPLWLALLLLSALPSVAAAQEGEGNRIADSVRPPAPAVADVIDRYVDERLAAEGIRPADLTDDAILIRRTMLDLVGRPATVAEVRAYQNDATGDKRTRLVDRLIASAGYIRQQSVEFDAMLMAGANGSLKDYLQEALRENRGWDRMFVDMLMGADKVAAERKATQFLLSRVQDLDKLTNQTSVAFFGVNVSCAKCHDHPEVGEWTQDRFFGMKSFFNRTFENGGFLGERDYGLVKFKTTQGEERDARLMFLTGTVVAEPPAPEPSAQDKKSEKKRLDELKKNKQPPPPASFSRRARLADVALRNGERDYFARAIVNKLWYRFFGYGLVMPVDQMHPENPSSHPELLRWLANDLIAGDYDLKRLIRGMVLSRTYARASRWMGEGDAPSPALFAVARLRPLTPDQYAAALRLAAANHDLLGEDHSEAERNKRLESILNGARGWVSLFERPAGGDFQVSVSEALLFNNSDRVRNDLLRDSGESLVGKLKTLDDTGAVVEAAVWSVFGRAPDEQERQLLAAFLDSRGDRPLEARRQLVWALLTSGHCRFNY